MNNRISLLRQYIEEDPADPFSRYALSLELIKSGNDDEALRQMEIVAKNHPDYLPNYYHYGKLVERLGNPDMAIEIYKQGMTVAQKHNDMHTLSELRGAIDLTGE